MPSWCNKSSDMSSWCKRIVSIWSRYYGLRKSSRAGTAENATYARTMNQSNSNFYLCFHTKATLFRIQSRCLFMGFLMEAWISVQKVAYKKQRRLAHKRLCKLMFAMSAEIQVVCGTATTH